MKLEDFYKNVLESTGFLVGENGEVLINKETPVMNKDLPYYIPTKENINTVYGSNGKIQKILFNPLIEDYFNKKNSNDSLKKIIVMSELYLTEKIINIAINLLNITDEPTGDFKLSNFYNSLGLLGKNNPNRKKLVDQNTHKVFDLVFSNVVSDPENRIVKFDQVRSGKIEKEKFNVVTSLYSPFLDTILNLQKEGPITELLGVKVRQKDVDIIIIILEFLLNGIKEENTNTIAIGSNNDYAGLESFLILYIALSEHLNEVTESLNNILKDDVEEDSEINLKLSLKDLEELPRLKSSAILVPSEKSLATRDLPEQHLQSSIKDKLNNYKTVSINTVNNNVIDNNIPNNILSGTLSQSPNVNYNTAPAENNLNSIMAKITGVVHQAVQQNNMMVPNINNYNGPRPDLHVANIYNEAEMYNAAQNNFGMYVPQGQVSRFDNKGTYLTASERQQQQMNFGGNFNRGGIIIP